MNQKNIFATLQQVMDSVREVEMVNERLPEVTESISAEKDEIQTTGMVDAFFGAPVLAIVSWCVWEWAVLDAIATVLSKIPLVSMITAPLYWESAWYINIPFHLIVDGIIVYRISKIIRGIFHREERECLKRLIAEKEELQVLKEENEKIIGTTLEILPEYHRNYNSIVGIVAAYNIGWADDLQNAMSAYAMNQETLSEWADAAYQPLREVTAYGGAGWKEAEIPIRYDTAEVSGEKPYCSEIMARHLMYNQYQAMKKNR